MDGSGGVGPPPYLLEVFGTNGFVLVKDNACICWRFPGKGIQVGLHVSIELVEHLGLGLAALLIFGFSGLQFGQ